MFVTPNDVYRLSNAMVRASIAAAASVPAIGMNGEPLDELLPYSCATPAAKAFALEMSESAFARLALIAAQPGAVGFA
jgi:hypothetical protein